MIDDDEDEDDDDDDDDDVDDDDGGGEDEDEDDFHYHLFWETGRGDGRKLEDLRNLRPAIVSCVWVPPKSESP